MIIHECKAIHAMCDSFTGIHVHDVNGITISVDFWKLSLPVFVVHQLLRSLLLVMATILNVYQIEM